MTSPLSDSHVRDVLIIGGGPAGLSAALALGRVRRTVVVFDAGKYRNAASEHAHTIPTHDHESPAALRHSMQQELQTRYHETVTILTGVGAKAVRPLAAATATTTAFAVEDTSGTCWTGRKLILAAGMHDVLLNTPGFREAWGKGIFHCPFCHGLEESRDGAAQVAFFVPRAGLPPSTADGFALFAQLLSQLAPHQTLLVDSEPSVDGSTTMTTTTTTTTTAKLCAVALARGMRVLLRPVARLTHVGGGDGPRPAQMRVDFADGSAPATFDFLFYGAATQLGGDVSAFVRALGLETTPTGELRIDSPQQATSRRGVFAAGDCAVVVKQVAMAMGTGVAAGAGASLEMAAEDLGGQEGQEGQEGAEEEALEAQT